MVGGWDDGSHTTAALAAFGLAFVADQPAVLCVWPENWAPLQLFRRLQTQWLYAGMGGAITGLRYESLGFWLDVDKVPREQWSDVTSCLQIMERHALPIVNRRAGKG